MEAGGYTEGGVVYSFVQLVELAYTKYFFVWYNLMFFKLHNKVNNLFFFMDEGVN